jgi:Flp pilus assembly protein TadG
VALEAALVTPLLVLILFGAIDIGQYVNVAQSVSNASREGARVAARNGTTTVTEVRNAILNYFSQTFPTLNAAQLSSAVTTSVTNESTGVAITDDDLTTIASGDPLSVTVSLDFSAVRWIPGLDYWSLSNKLTTTVVRRE